MSKYELSMTPGYAPDWTVVDAIREIFQNALDQETQVPDNKMSVNYDEETEVLTISNKNSVLEPSSLLLGATTKADDDSTIGQFGEGYKMATLVLMREGLELTIYNYGKNEIWQPRFIKSRRYGKQQVLAFETSRAESFIKAYKHNKLTFVVKHVDQEMYDKVVRSNLHLDNVYTSIDTEKGQILLDERMKHRLYVNGLYISTCNDVEYGYNFKPKELKLGRDRKLLDAFDVRWKASSMWALTKEYNRIEEMLNNGVRDVEYINHSGYGSTVQQVSQQLADNFVKQYTDKAVPISSERERALALIEKPDCIPVIVKNEAVKEMLKRKIKQVEEIEPTIEVYDKLRNWWESIKDNLTEEQITEGAPLIDYAVDTLRLRS